MRITLSARPDVPERPSATKADATSPGPSEAPRQETLQAFKDAAADNKQAIADAVRRLRAASAADAGGVDAAREALGRTLAELVDVVSDQARASEGADLLVVSIGSDAVAPPLTIDIRA